MSLIRYQLMGRILRNLLVGVLRKKTVLLLGFFSNTYVVYTVFRFKLTDKYIQYLLYLGKQAKKLAKILNSVSPVTTRRTDNY